ncbi:MAG: hypothetical protein ABI823_12050 [Bryobacteraceae bacterium]
MSEAPRTTNRWRPVFIGPSPRLLEELEPLVRPYSATQLQTLRDYPKPEALEQFLVSKNPTLCFVDLASDKEKGFAQLAQIQKIKSDLSIITLLSGNDPELILRCLRQGAADFLIQPFTNEQVEAALGKLARLLKLDDGANQNSAKIFCFMPAKGACGASTLSSSFAFQCKRLGAKRILLADLDPLTGTLSFLLKVKSSYSFMDVLTRGAERDLDDDLWRSMVTTSSGVDVLLAPEMLVEGVNEVRDAGPILEFARSRYDVIVVDMGAAYGDWALSLARMANELILVTTNELPALQAAQRVLGYLDNNRIGRWKIKLVVNRYHRDVGLNREVIGTALHTEVFHIVPSDYEAVQRALMEGKPIPTSSAFGKAITQLADRIGGREESGKKPSSLSGLLSLFSRTSS